MKSLPRLGAFGIAAIIAFAGCAGPQTEGDVTHLKELIDAGETQKVNQLILALDSTDPTVREATVRALADLEGVALIPLQDTVQKGNARSGPALLALGLMGDPDQLTFIRSFAKDPDLGVYSRQSQRIIEDMLYKAATEDNGGLPAMETYLQYFPEGNAADEIRQMRLEALGRISFSRLKNAPDMESMRKFLELYGETQHGDEVRQMMVVQLFTVIRGELDAGNYEGARGHLQEVAVLDPRRGSDVTKLRAESHILEGEDKLAQGERAGALAAFEQAARFADVREEASRRMARILFEDGRTLLDGPDVMGAMAKLERAGELDPSLKPEVSRLKTETVRRLLVEVEDPDGAAETPLKQILSFGIEAVRPMEEYLGGLFVSRQLEAVEEVMTVLGITLAPYRGGAQVEEPPPIAATRLRDSLAGFIRSGYTTSLAEVSRLFSSTDFQGGWTRQLNPLDPRQSSLVLRVEQVTANYLGLLRIGLVFKAMLGDSGLEVISGTPIPDAQLKIRVSQGDIGVEGGTPLLGRVQLAGTYAALMGDLVRQAKANPERVLKMATGIVLPIQGPGQWVQLAEGVKSEQELTGLSRQLLKVEADPRQVSLSIYDPVVKELPSADAEIRSAVEARAMGLLMGLSPIVYGLYPGVDRVTVIVGQQAGARFEPQTRYVITESNYRAAARLGESPRDRQARFELLSTRWVRWEQK